MGTRVEGLCFGLSVLEPCKPDAGLEPSTRISKRQADGGKGQLRTWSPGLGVLGLGGLGFRV